MKLKNLHTFLLKKDSNEKSLAKAKCFYIKSSNNIIILKANKNCSFESMLALVNLV